jgi:predicted DNA binding CopG/RHH family protein
LGGATSNDNDQAAAIGVPYQHFIRQLLERALASQR